MPANDLPGAVLSAERLEELARLEAEATLAPWHFEHRCSGYDMPPATGIDEVVGLGWDWDPGTGNVPPEPMRGVFALGADAALVEQLRNNARALIALAQRTTEADAGRDAALADLHAYVNDVEPKLTEAEAKLAEVTRDAAEMTGKQWAEGRSAFQTWAERYRQAPTHEKAAIIADVAPQEIWRAMQSVRSPEPGQKAEAAVVEAAPYAIAPFHGVYLIPGPGFPAPPQFADRTLAERVASLLNIAWRAALPQHADAGRTAAQETPNG